MPFTLVSNGPVTLNIAVEGSGPLIICVHGWPELSHAWRHQLAHFSALGYTVAAMDVRGYGGSSKPHEISAYSMRNLTRDVAAVADALGGGKAILFGHDWGAPIAWNTAILFPDKIAAVAGLSVPYSPIGPRSFLEMARSLYKDRFFYQIYIQAEGVAEAEVEADVRTALRKLYYSSCGDAPRNGLLENKPADAKLLDGLIDPNPFPAWMSESDLQVFVDAFTAGGWRGPFNRYRAQDIDSRELGSRPKAVVTQPSFFVAGEKDPVRAFVPGLDLYAAPGAACSDFRGSVILPGIGHWVQQEAPAETNAALESFLKGL
jgi:pimeloyl-ACP methyl ester carboxylesterase